MKLGSLFDGIGGWQLAAINAGIEPVWSSEIETFPLEVTKRRFPNTKQLGDVTKINGAEIEPCDIITSGSPCQDFSVANAERNGLDGTRSGLWFHADRIIRQMRVSTGGVYPRFYILENVPGILSSNQGMDFRTILATLTDTEIPIPRSGKWANAGMVRSRRCDVGWRILDAQYLRSTQGNFLLPQRRRRLWLVADFAESHRCAEKILFECEGLSGDTEPSRKTRERPASNIEKSIRTTDRITNRGGSAFLKIRSGLDDGNAGKGALIGMDASFTLGCNNDQTLFQETVSTVGGQIYDITHDSAARQSEISPTLQARMGTGGNQVPILTENIPNTDKCVVGGYSEVVLNDQGGQYMEVSHGVTGTLRAEMGGHQPIVTMESIPEVYALEGNGSRPSHLGNGYSNNGTMYTLNTVEVHSVAMSTTGGQAYAIGNGSANSIEMSPKAGTLTCMHDQIAVLIATPGESSEVCAPTMAEDSTDKMCRTEN